MTIPWYSRASSSLKLLTELSKSLAFISYSLEFLEPKKMNREQPNLLSTENRKRICSLRNFSGVWGII